MLERGRVGDTWRTKRWDGFALNTPNWAQRLPGHEYAGPEPDAFAPATRWSPTSRTTPARSPRPSARAPASRPCAATATAISSRPAATALRARERDRERGRLPEPHAHRAGRRRARRTCSSCTRASTSIRTSSPPARCSSWGAVSPAVRSPTSSTRRRRTTYLAVGRCPWFPRRYRGRDLVRWAIDVGLMDETVDTLPSPAARLRVQSARVRERRRARLPPGLAGAAGHGAARAPAELPRRQRAVRPRARGDARLGRRVRGGLPAARGRSRPRVGARRPGSRARGDARRRPGARGARPPRGRDRDDPVGERLPARPGLARARRARRPRPARRSAAA